MRKECWIVTTSPSSQPDAVGGGLSIREHLAASCCETPGRPLMLARHAEIRHAILFRPNCKKWSCDFCGQQRAAWFAVLAAHGYDALTLDGTEVMFWTVTSHRNIRSLVKGIFVWRQAWPKLRKRLQRAAENVAYASIPEQHKDGSLHIHLLVAASVTERWCKDNAAQVGLGYIGEYEQVRTAGKAAWYVSKYLTKESHKLQWPKYFRRVNTSRNWPRPEPLEKSEQWAVTRLKSDASVSAWNDVLKAQGWLVSTFTA